MRSENWPAFGPSACWKAFTTKGWSIPSIKDEVVLVGLPEEEFLEQAPQVGIVGAILEAQAPAVVQVGHEFTGRVLAEDLAGRGHPLLHDFLLLLLLRVRFQPLPGQGTTDEIRQDVAHGLEVVPPGLLDPEMGVHARIPGRAREVLVLPVGDVLLGLQSPVLLRQTEVDDVNLVRLLPELDEEVFRLDLSASEVLRMHVLHPVDHLVREHEDGLQATLPTTETDEVLQGGP